MASKKSTGPVSSGPKNPEISSSTSHDIDAPPPYTNPSSSSSYQPIPHQTILPPPPLSHVEAGLLNNRNGWVPPANESIARSRAQRRFWGAMFWAFLIWILLCLILGGGIHDFENAPPGRKGHWDNNGRWHNDNDKSHHRYKFSTNVNEGLQVLDVDLGGEKAEGADLGVVV